MSNHARDQEKFYSVYRGRQGGLFHLAYMRSAKVKAARMVLERNGFPLRDRRVLDWGFGSGTFLRACDTSCHLSGVEVDTMNVEAVRAMLAERGHDVKDVQVLDVATWDKHPIIADGVLHDIMLLSHVLEHLDDPVGVLKRLGRNLVDGGVIAALLPLNELHPDENHKCVCDHALVKDWAARAGFTLVDYAEVDHYVYYAQPLMHAKGRFGRMIAQGVSLVLGLAQAPFGPRAWFAMGKALRVVGAKPGQIAFLLKKQ